MLSEVIIDYLSLPDSCRGVRCLSLGGDQEVLLRVPADIAVEPPACRRVFRGT